MSEKIPEILDEGEEVIDIEPVEIELKGRSKYEDIIWKGHPHIASQIIQIFFGALLLLAGIIFLLYAILTSDLIIVGISILSIIFGFLTLLFSYYHMKFTRYVITDSAVYKQKGWISDHVTQIPADKIHTLTYDQSIIEKILNFGTVGLSTGGQEIVEIEFESVKNPKSVHNRIDNLMEDRVERRRPNQNNSDKMSRIKELERELEKTKENLDESYEPKELEEG